MKTEEEKLRSQSMNFQKRIGEMQNSRVDIK